MNGLPTELYRLGCRGYLPAATKLGQSNIFTSVCLSTGGGCLVWGGPISWGVSNFSVGGCLQFLFGGCLQFFGGSPIFWRESPIFRGGGSPNFFFSNFFSQNFFWDTPTPPPPRRSMPGRYASYWNAFLFRNDNLETTF